MEIRYADTIISIHIDKIVESPYQGRLIEKGNKETGEMPKNIQELANNIKENGLVNPILVRPLPNGDYELIDGHRRLLAHKLLKLPIIKAILRPLDDRQAQAQSIIGNLQRQNLSNIELALSYRKVLDAGIFKDARDLSKSLSKDETYISDTLNLLKLDNRIIEDLLKNDTIGDVRLLRQIRHAGKIDENGKNEEQWELYCKVVSENLTREDVSHMLGGGKKEKPLFAIKRRKSSMQILVNTKHLGRNELNTIEKAIQNLLNKYE